VMWTPRGYYDSSADGDRKFLGWLTNRGQASQLLAGAFDSIDKFERRYRQPRNPGNAIDLLLDSGNPLLADVPEPAQPVANPSTSRVDILALSPAAVVARPPGPLVVTTPSVVFDYRALAAKGAASIRELWVEINGRRILNNIPPLAAPVQDAQGQISLPIGAERNLVANLVVLDSEGIRRTQSIEIKNQAPPVPTTRKSRLEVIAIGADRFLDKRFPRILYAENDVREVSGFLGERLIDPVTGAPFQHDQFHGHPFIGAQVEKAGILAKFDELKAQANAGILGPGDVVAVVIESHFLDLHSLRLLATSEPANGLPEPPSFSATELADRLGELTKLGCRVFVLLDAVHDVKGAAWDNDIQEWVRYLQGQSKALVFIASDHGPSSALGDGHRIFAQGILDVIKARNQGRLRKPGGTMSLFDFQRTVADAVLQQTGRKQHAQCYLPDTLSFSIPFLDVSPHPH